MALFSLYKSNTEYQYEEGKGIASDHTTFHNLGTASGDKTLSSSYTESSLSHSLSVPTILIRAVTWLQLHSVPMAVHDSQTATDGAGSLL